MSELVSIIIPAYNAANWICRSIDSVLGQTYSPLELVVVNDGSTDNTGAVCATYGDRIRYLEKPNGGEGSARNFGIRHCHGRIVGFLDADDEFLSHMVSALMAGFAISPNVGAVSGAHSHDCDGCAQRVPPAGQVLPAGRSIGIVEDFFRAYAKSILVCTGAVLVRREVLENVGGFREGMKYGADIDMWTRIAGRTKWAFVDQEVAIYHHSPASSVTLQESVRLPNVDWAFPEKMMQQKINPDQWDSYRLFRRDRILGVCRTLLYLGATSQTREALKTIPPAPVSLQWLLMRFLTHLPASMAKAVAHVVVRVKGSLRDVVKK